MIIYRKVSESDADSVHKLIRANVGFDAHELSTTLYLIQESAIVAIYRSKIIGFCSLVSVDKDTLECRMLVVDPKFRKMGVGKTIISRLLLFVKNKNVIARCWVYPASGKEITSDILFKKLGFTEINQVMDYWAKDCKSNAYCCYFEEKCRCTMKLLKKHIN